MLNSKTKFKLISFILILNVIISIFPVIAQETEVTFGDPGTTMPGDFFHPFEIFWEDLTGVSEEKQIEERLAEANALINDGNYEDAAVALEEASDSHEDLQTELETLAERTVGKTAEETINTETSLQEDDDVLHNSVEEVVGTEKTIQTLDAQLDAIESELIKNVENGELPENHEVLISLNNVEGASAGTQEVLVGETEQVKEIISTEIGVSKFEAELVVSDIKEDLGLYENYKKDVNPESLLVLKTTIVEVEEKIETLADTGENTKAAEQLLANAELHLQRAEDALESGDIGEAHDLFTSTEHLTANADKFLKAPDANRDEVETLVETPQEIKIRLEKEEHTDYAGDDNYWEELAKKYPEHADEIKAEQKRAKDINKLFATTNLEQKINELLAEGKSEEEVHKLVVDAYGHLYGEEYLPPGTYFTEIGKDEDTEEKIRGGISEVATDEKGNIIGGYYEGEFITTADIKAGGGFIYDYKYTDHTTDNDYEYKLKDGTNTIEYTDVLGQTYIEELPANYDPQLEYKKGNEEHEINYESPTGENVVVKYSALGYEVKTDKGEELAKEAYEEGSYSVAGGAEVKIDEAIGYTLENKNREATVYTYNPEFKNYYDVLSGLTHSPDVSSHVERTVYDAEKKKYNSDYGDKDYFFDTSKNSWTLPDGKSLAVQVAIAPIGEEDKGEVKLAHGETWKYNSLTKEWTSSTGEKYTPAPNNYIYAEAGESHVDPYTGKTWTTSASEKGVVWKSSDGETWNPSTGSHTNDKGIVVEGYGVYHDESGEKHTTEYDWYEGDHYIQNPSGTYSYYDSAKVSSTYIESGVTWTLNPTTGQWTSSTGGSYDPSQYHAGEAHPDIAGHVGTYGGTTEDYSGYSGTYTDPSSGVTYSAPSGYTEAPHAESGGGGEGGHSEGGGGH